MAISYNKKRLCTISLASDQVFHDPDLMKLILSALGTDYTSGIRLMSTCSKWFFSAIKYKWLSEYDFPTRQLHREMKNLVNEYHYNHAIFECYSSNISYVASQAMRKEYLDIRAIIISQIHMYAMAKFLKHSFNKEIIKERNDKLSFDDRVFTKMINGLYLVEFIQKDELIQRYYFRLESYIDKKNSSLMKPFTQEWANEEYTKSDLFKIQRHIDHYLYYED